jgi:hypothetical protein
MTWANRWSDGSGQRTPPTVQPAPLQRQSSGRVPKERHLMQYPPKPGMHHAQREAESTLAFLTMADDNIAGGQQGRNAHGQSATLPAVPRASKYERALLL